MSQLNIKTITSAFVFLLFPSFAFAVEAMNTMMMEHESTYMGMHWGDVTSLALVLVAAGYAFLSAKVYGGVIGVALKFISVGLVGVILHRLLGSFEHLGVNIISHDAGIILDLVGFSLIAFGMYKLYSETKSLASGSEG